MTKTKLETFIKKYSLGGTLDEVRWISNGKTLKVSEMTSDKKFLATVEMKNFDAFKETEFVVTNTPKLKSLISALSENVTVDLNAGEDDENRIISINVADEKNSFVYNTGDSEHLQKKPKIQSIPNYEVEIKLTEDFVNSFSKAKAALSDVQLFTFVMSKKNRLEMVLGYSSNINTDRFVLSLDTLDDKNKLKEPASFSAGILKEILAANSEVKDPIFKVSEQGLAYVEFDTPDFNAKYYMIKVPVED